MPPNNTTTASRYTGTRTAGGAPAARPATTNGAALVHAQSDAAVRGTFRLPAEVEDALRRAQESCHLVSPATTAAALPEGCSIAMSPVLVDVAMETYAIPGSDDEGGGKRGLGKNILDRIFAASGGSWDPVMTRRLDDGSHPYFVHYQAVGTVKNFDGSSRTVKGEKVVDMREGSPAIQDLVEVSIRKLRKFAKLGWQAPTPPAMKAEARSKAENQVRALRLHILGHAESKAKNRAIRSLGIRTSYTAEELRKPFVVARPMFTGYSDDPAIRQMFAVKIADTFLGSSAALYGAPPALPPGAPPPPVGTRRDHEDDDAIDTEAVYDEPAAREPEPTPSQREPATRREAAPRAERPAPADASPVIPFGRAKGGTVRDADDDDLEWVQGALAGMIEDPAKARFRADNIALWEAIDTELRRRRGEDGEPTETEGENVDPETGEIY